MQKGLIHYYYGRGKGKTSAAMGAAIRQLGHGGEAIVVQFLKARASGEITLLQTLPKVTVFRGREGDGMPSRMSLPERERTLAMHNHHLEQAIALATSGPCSLLVLDEVADACELKLLDEARLFEFLNSKPQTLEVVMTGHEPLGRFMEIADYVTEMRKEKHPYDRGIIAREGIEY